jgi:hypothetical protein
LEDGFPIQAFGNDHAKRVASKTQSCETLDFGRLNHAKARDFASLSHPRSSAALMKYKRLTFHDDSFIVEAVHAMQEILATNAPATKPCMTWLWPYSSFTMAESTNHWKHPTYRWLNRYTLLNFGRMVSFDKT